jgi:hypothetical protein
MPCIVPIAYTLAEYWWCARRIVSRDDLDPLCQDVVNELHARLLGKGPGPRH